MVMTSLDLSALQIIPKVIDNSVLIHSCCPLQSRSVAAHWKVRITTTRMYGNLSPVKSASATAGPSCATRWSARIHQTVPIQRFPMENAAPSAPTVHSPSPLTQSHASSVALKCANTQPHALGNTFHWPVIMSETRGAQTQHWILSHLTWDWGIKDVFACSFYSLLANYTSFFCTFVNSTLRIVDQLFLCIQICKD